VDSLHPTRSRYAEALRKIAGLRSEALVRAFASVYREDYLGPGPWRILEPGNLGGGYQTTPDDNPAHLYRNVLVAIDEKRHLNNGEPAGLARWLDALDVAPGDRVLHIGCGVGYYTAILAEVVGPLGHVAGVEAYGELAVQAGRNLGRYANVEVVYADGSTCDVGSRDVIFVNAGATHPMPIWLDRLRPGGRLLLPLTVALPGIAAGAGQMLKVVRNASAYSARFVSPVGIFHCTGARTDAANERLKAAYLRGNEGSVRRLRRDDHPEGEGCWLHGEGFCLSQEP
jgi:protein-L-isoaspartate(D-aspartate) O-methyltransferase